jgi:S1-C subfamily serine protease
VFKKKYKTMKPFVSTMLLLFLASQLKAQKAPEMLEKVISAVVTVAVYKTDDTKQALGYRGEGDVAYQKILDLSGSQSSGSGFIIERKGKKYVVTNAHVVENARDEEGALFIYSINRTKYPVKIVGGDSFYDIAVLEFLETPGKELEVIDFRKDEARLGETVYALGNPLGEYPYTVTDGIVSAKNRVRGGVTGKFGFLQTTATVIWGNSGGPLVDGAGQVLGINSQIAFANRGDAQIWQPQINFALEAGLSNRLVNDIIDNGGLVKRAYLGLEIGQRYEYNAFLALYGTPWAQKDSLPVIKNILSNSPASSVLAGKAGAEIIKVNGTEVRNVQEVLGEFEKIRPGAEVKMEIRYAGKTENISFKSQELNTKHLEDLAKYVIRQNKNSLLTTDQKNVIIQGDNQHKREQPRREDPRREAPEGREPNRDRKKEEERKRENNLRYRGMVEETAVDYGQDYKVIAGGIETDNYSSVWRVTKMSDLGAAFRLSGLAGTFNVYVADPYGGEPRAIAINPSGDDTVYQPTLWY